ncbi:unnamed protein product [Larinioides sclopetarius]|uniref:NADH dehydrogenase [ubiquinone] 1 beta subcomplex subunit 10 n=1 Tax=Larinioides sclopetarius TaxID=280406 RepID=A0AAV2ABB2_9ARAC
MDEDRNAFARFCKKLINLIDGPVTWFRETVVLPNQKQYPYYHRVYPRVPTIDECYEKDAPCMYEANEQFKRDMKIDGAIVDILRKRKVECVRYEGHERHERCKKIFDEYTEAELNYFIKYGDLGAFPHAKHAYMKQKHRMVYERRKEAGTWNPKRD